jgi:hypothetical protein
LECGEATFLNFKFFWLFYYSAKKILKALYFGFAFKIFLRNVFNFLAVFGLFWLSAPEAGTRRTANLRTFEFTNVVRCVEARSRRGQ